MRRTLSWLVAGALVAGLGGASMASSTDSFIPVQDPPTIEIGNLNQFYGVGGASSVVNRILPSASMATVRDGFTSNAVAFDIENGTSFSTDPADSASLERVARDGEVTTAPYYRQQVTVKTNGPTDSIKRVGYCLINTQDVTAVASDDATFRWYDASEDPETNDLERNCGFNDEDPTASGLPDSARAVISIIYTLSGDTGTFEVQGDNQHEVITVGSNTSDATWDELTKTLTVNFAFKPSHALMKQTSGWVVRAAAQDAPAEITDGSPGETTFDPQMSQVFWGNGTNNIQGQLNLANSDEASRADWKFASVGYYGAIMSERADVAYGTLTKGEERIITGITTGRYVANASSKIWIHASDFELEGLGGSSLTYETEDATEPGDQEVLFRCSYESGSGQLNSESLGSGPVIVSTTAQQLKTGLEKTIDVTTPEDALSINSAGMSCALKYGGGADDAAEKYINEVTLSIMDDTGDYIGPTGALVP